MASGTWLGSQMGKPPSLDYEGLRAAPASRSVQPPPRVRGAGSRSLQGGRGGGARDRGARERAPGGTRKRRAPARGALGVAGGARGRCGRASGARAPVRPGARRVGARSRHPGEDPAQATPCGGPAERGSEREAGGRQPLAPEGPSEVGAAGPVLGSRPGGETGESSRAGPRAPAAETSGRAARRHRSRAGRRPRWPRAGCGAVGAVGARGRGARGAACGGRGGRKVYRGGGACARVLGGGVRDPGARP